MSSCCLAAARKSAARGYLHPATTTLCILHSVLFQPLTSIDVQTGDTMIRFTMLIIVGCVSTTTVRNVYWNTTAASFSDEPRTVMVNQGNLPWEYDQVNIICPVYKPGTREREQHIIYSVEKDEFDNCRVTSPRPKIVAICNRPQTFMYFTITFRSFTPTPGGLEFRPGKEYYFISTSNNKDIHRRVGGWCSSHNMKMIFKVAENADSEKVMESVTQNPIPSPAAFWSKFRTAKAPGSNRMSENPNPEYQQSQGDTYFSDSSNKMYDFRSMLDESVDISITGRAYSSASSTRVSSSFLVSTVLLASIACI